MYKWQYGKSKQIVSNSRVNFPNGTVFSYLTGSLASFRNSFATTGKHENDFLMSIIFSETCQANTVIH